MCLDRSRPFLPGGPCTWHLTRPYISVTDASCRIARGFPYGHSENRARLWRVVARTLPWRDGGNREQERALRNPRSTGTPARGSRGLAIRRTDGASRSPLDRWLHSGVPVDLPWRHLPLVLASAFAIRAAVALAGDFVLHPDEIMQYLEPAHRLAFGNGVTSWEHFYGARSWLIPGAIAAPLKLFDLAGTAQPAGSSWDSARFRWRYRPACIASCGVTAQDHRRHRCAAIEIDAEHPGHPAQRDSRSPSIRQFAWRFLSYSEPSLRAMRVGTKQLVRFPVSCYNTRCIREQ